MRRDHYQVRVYMWRPQLGMDLKRLLCGYEFDCPYDRVQSFLAAGDSGS